MGYIPPFNINDEMLESVTQIVEMLGSIVNADNLAKLPKLRRVGRIKSIHSSLAIENNSLTIEQVSDIINGKSVLAPPSEIQVKSALEAYQEIENTNPFITTELLRIHTLMMKGLIDNPGVFRSGPVGVFDSAGNLVHMAPPASKVPELISDLFSWLKNK